MPGIGQHARAGVSCGGYFLELDAGDVDTRVRDANGFFLRIRAAFLVTASRATN
jgi:hypothetical protein